MFLIYQVHICELTCIDWVLQVLQVQERIQAVWETDISVWVCKLWHKNKTFQVLFFQLYFNKKYVEVAVIDFAMNLIILKWLRRRKCRQKKKTIRQKDFKAKEKIAYDSVFSDLKHNR